MFRHMELMFTVSNSLTSDSLIRQVERIKTLKIVISILQLVEPFGAISINMTFLEMLGLQLPLSFLFLFLFLFIDWSLLQLQFFFRYFYSFRHWIVTSLGRIAFEISFTRREILPHIDSFHRDTNVSETVRQILYGQQFHYISKFRWFGNFHWFLHEPLLFS